MTLYFFSFPTTPHSTLALLFTFLCICLKEAACCNNDDVDSFNSDNI